MSFIENIIKDNTKYSPEYGNGLSNHLSMAVLALNKIGAKKEQISKFVDNYSLRLELDNGKTSISTLKSKYKRLFINNGTQQVISDMTNKLFNYLTAGGFHAIIRVAYAINSLKESIISEEVAIDELSLSFAYWDNKKTIINYKNKKVNLHDVITSFNELNIPQLITERNLIYNDLLYISKHEIYLNYSGIIEFNPINFEILREFALQVYINTQDFTAIHMITLFHAIRIIQPYLSQNTLQQSQTIIWNNLLAAAIRSHSNDVKENFSMPHTYSFNDCEEKARNSLDDHMIKLFYTLKEEYNHYQDERYKLAAYIMFNIGA